jgi:glycine cleavage system H protein
MIPSFHPETHLVNVPANLKYTKSHEWIRIEGDVATIGITDFAQSELGDIVYVDLPSVGRTLQHEETCGTVESVKTVSDIYAPVAGEVVAVNEALTNESELVNKDPFEAGWMLKIKMSDPAAAANLLDAAGYRAVLEG